MADRTIRELERSLAANDQPDARVALAKEYERRGDYTGAAKTILPLAFEPVAERVVRGLLGRPQPQTLPAAANLLAQRLFWQDPDPALRLAYLRGRITVSDVYHAISSVIPALATQNIRATFNLLQDDDHYLDISPGTPRFIVSTDGHITIEPSTFAVARTYCPLFTHLEPVATTLHASGFTQARPREGHAFLSTSRGVDTDGNGDNTLQDIGIILSRPDASVTLSAAAQPYCIKNDRSVPASCPANLKEVVLFWPKGAR